MSARPGPFPLAHGADLALAPMRIWVAAAFYSRMATGGARTYADWLWVRLAA